MKKFKRSPLVVITTAFSSENFIEQNLDCIFSEINILDNVNCSVFLAIDACQKTEYVLRKIASKYGNRLHVYMAKKNSGTYLLKNSLLNKIEDKNSIVFFFDSDDILPCGFIKKYYEYFRKKLLESNAECISEMFLRTMSLGISNELLNNALIMQKNSESNINNVKLKLHERNVDVSFNLLIDLARRKIVTTNIYKIIFYMSRFLFLKNNISDKMTSQYSYRSPHGCFFATYKALDALGYFNEFRVSQDTDILNRAEALKIPIVLSKALPPFFRRVTTASLTKSSKYGLGSEYRKDIIAENKRRIDDGVFIASKKTVTLEKIF